MNQFVKTAGLDLTVDETTWANALYADVQGHIKGKPGVVKGGQHTLVVDANRRFVYGYTARHKYFEQKKPLTQEGPAEVNRLVDTLMPLIVGSAKKSDDKRRQIFFNHLVS